MKFSVGALKSCQPSVSFVKGSLSYTSCKGISEFSPVLSIFFD